LQKLVIAMKKLRHEATTLYFGRLLAARLQVTGAASEIDLIVPVPSHWWRRLIRKVSTAEVLAETVANELHIPWTQQLVRRTRYTPKQGMLRAADRKHNVQGAFVAKLPSRWRNARILLIDDVLTSGSTASEVSRALLQAGAKEVMVGAIARALGDQRPNLV
jgi:predicted amidophosphoribosyltransferase